MVSHIQVFALVALLLSAHVLAQAPRANGGDTQAEIVTANNEVVEFAALAPVDPGTAAFMAKLEEECGNDFRNIDGSCTNKANRLWGSANRPQLLPDGVSNTVFPNTDLPSARLVSNLVCKQSKDKFSRRGLSEMVTFFGQFVDHNLVVSRDESRFLNVVRSGRSAVLYVVECVLMLLELTFRSFFVLFRLLQRTRRGSAPSSSPRTIRDMPTSQGDSHSKGPKGPSLKVLGAERVRSTCLALFLT